MTDEKKSKYIRLSSEYYGGFTVTYQYVQMKDDEPIINFYTYESIDEGWFVIENDEKAKMLLEEQAKIKLNKRTGRYFTDSDIEYGDNEVVKFSRIDKETSGILIVAKNRDYDQLSFSYTHLKLPTKAYV